MIESVQNTIPHLPQHIFHDDLGTLAAEVGAALVPGPGWEEGSVMREDLEGDHLKLFKDTHHHVEDFLVEKFAKACSEVGEGGLAGQVLHGKAGISSIGPSPVLIAKQGEQVIAIEVSPVKVTKEVNEEDAGGIIARRTNVSVTMGDETANEGEIDQRGDHSWVTTSNGAVRKNFDKSFIESVD